MSAAVPYVIGQWVRGPRFYGRRAEVAALLGSPHRRLWIAGLRRIGKTSLLRQLDLLAGADGGTRLPLFWDLQGVDGEAELNRGFADALLDAEEVLARRGIPLAEIEDFDVVSSLERLLAALRRRGVALLLLCDEADELGRLAGELPELVSRLTAAVVASEGGCLVLASSLRLCDLAAAEGGARALVEGSAPPLHLGVLAADEARSLVRQSQLPEECRPSFDAATVEAIRDHCGDHPMLLQLLAKRCQELGSLDEALRQVAADRAVEHLFAVDFDLLAEPERQVLLDRARGEVRISAGGAAAGGPGLRRLVALGLIRPCEDGRWTIPNRLFAAWLRGQVGG